MVRPLELARRTRGGRFSAVPARRVRLLGAPAQRRKPLPGGLKVEHDELRFRGPRDGHVEQPRADQHFHVLLPVDDDALQRVSFSDRAPLRLVNGLRLSSLSYSG